MSGFTGFTLEHYSAMFADSRLMLILIQTFFLAFLSSILATAIGTFGAIFIYQARRKHQHAILSLNNILMVAPDVMIGGKFPDSLYPFSRAISFQSWFYDGFA